MAILIGFLVITSAFLIQIKLYIIGIVAVIISKFVWWFFFMSSGLASTFFLSLVGNTGLLR